MTQAVAGLKSRIERLETSVERALLAIEEAQAEVQRQRADTTPPQPVVDRSEVMDRPSWSMRGGVAEAAVERAKRQARERSEELDRARALMAAAERRDVAIGISAYEKQAAAAIELERRTAGWFGRSSMTREDVRRMLGYRTAVQRTGKADRTTAV